MGTIITYSIIAVLAIAIAMHAWTTDRGWLWAGFWTLYSMFCAYSAVQETCKRLRREQA